jgi:hypothetical protein
MPMQSFTAQDAPTWIDDTSLYGNMSALQGTQQGGVHSEFSGASPFFGDWTPALFHNILGDLSEDGAYSGAGTTTLSSPAVAGASTITCSASVTTGTAIVVGQGTAHAEIVTTSSTGVSPTLLTPLRFGHLTAEVVRPVIAPFTHAESLLNTAQAQPGSLTLVDWIGLTPTTQARAYSGCALSDLSLKGVAESEFISTTFKGLGWPSVPASALPAVVTTTAQPLASWRTLVGFAGPASGGTKVLTVSEFQVDIARQLKATTTMQGSQAPYIIQRGNLAVSGTFTIPVPSDETFFGYMINNTQPQIQLVISNGLAGNALLALQIDLQNGAVKGAQVQKAEAVGYQITFEGVAQTANAGGSGGRSPIKLTSTNAIGGNSY